MQRMGITDDDLENLSGEMSEALGSLEGMLSGQEQDGGDDDEQDLSLIHILYIFRQSVKNPLPPSSKSLRYASA